MSQVYIHEDGRWKMVGKFEAQGDVDHEVKVLMATEFVGIENGGDVPANRRYSGKTTTTNCDLESPSCGDARCMKSVPPGSIQVFAFSRPGNLSSRRQAYQLGRKDWLRSPSTMRERDRKACEVPEVHVSGVQREFL